MKLKSDSKESSDNKIPAIIITGPTASGKTSLSLDVAKMYDGEILCCDSMQIYRYMDIGTAKATSEEKTRVVHHLIDIVNPWEEYSVADYCDEARKTATDVFSRGKMPVFVGGTGLYVTSLVEGYSFDASPEADPEITKKLNEQAETETGMQELYDFLRSNDPEAASAIHINNKKRVIRAVELYMITGKTQSERNAESKTEGSFLEPTVYAIDYERQALCDRIAKRVDIMIKNGLIEEVEGLMKLCKTEGRELSRTAAQAIGYREVLSYLNGDINKEKMCDKIKIATRQYAKRQMTWLRKWPWIHWIEPTATAKQIILQ